MLFYVRKRFSCFSGFLMALVQPCFSQRHPRHVSAGFFELLDGLPGILIPGTVVAFMDCQIEIAARDGSYLTVALRIFPAGHMLFAVCYFQFKAKLLFSLTHRNSAVMAAVSDFLLMDNVFHTVDASDEIF